VNTRAVANGVWKFLAVSMVAVFVAVLVPSLGWFVDTRDQPTQAQIDVIRERQLQVLVHLASLDEQLKATRALLVDLQLELREHEKATKP